jgi:hypothetical protein
VAAQNGLQPADWGFLSFSLVWRTSNFAKLEFFRVLQSKQQSSKVIENMSEIEALGTKIASLETKLEKAERDGLPIDYVVALMNQLTELRKEKNILLQARTTTTTGNHFFFLLTFFTSLLFSSQLRSHLCSQFPHNRMYTFVSLHSLLNQNFV